MFKNKKACIAFAMAIITGMASIPQGSVSAGDISIDVSIDTTQGRTSISSYIYGGNWDFNNAKITAKRLGGNRMTGYNWENNFSNAGSDWQQSSDTYMLSNTNVPMDKWTQPGSVLTTFHDLNLSEGIPYSLITLQAAGYVSADDKGSVSEAQTAPSARWKEVKFNKGSALSLTPDTADNYVYMDELVNFLVNKYGNASTSTGVRAYAIDNEPALWPSTHPRIHPANTQCSEILNKSVGLSKTIKSLDPYAEVFGPVLYGFAAYNDFQGAPDWNTVKGGYRWFLDYYLDNMKKASETEGKRLLDVLDLHWYPEAMGGGVRITTSDASNIDCNKARLQAPRTLWDATYKEDSWIAQWCSAFLPLLPNVRASIDKYYPETKLAFTEYSYGADEHITGGIAEADVLGIFGKYGVYAANIWGGGSYTASGINLYTNYDGNGSRYGNTNVKCDTSDVANSSAYASIVDANDNKLHIVVMNKSYDSPATFNFSINSSVNYKSASVWGFDSDSAAITQRQDVSSISGNKFSYTLPALSAYHIVLDGPAEPDTFTLSGYVNPDVSSTEGLIKSGFKVEIGETGLNAETDEDGYFEIGGIPATGGPYNLKISKEGYLTRNIADIPEGRNNQIGSKTSPAVVWAGDVPVHGAADGAINMADIIEIAGSFNSTPGNDGYNAAYDYNLDGSTNMADIVIVAKHFNTTASNYPVVAIN